MLKLGMAGDATVEPAGNGLALARLSELAAEFGADWLASDATSLMERVAEGRFFVACVGQFKRGKSTLLDALIRQRLLPTGIVPVTAVPTVVRYGKAIFARIRTGSQDWQPIPISEIEQYVSEEHNPENAKKVAAVEVFVPSPLLSTGMCLVDTPGLGSVFTANTEETKAFLPHIDAVIAVIGADPPLSADELALLKDASERVRDLLIVLNKADRVTRTEIAAATLFASQILEKRLGREVGRIYEVSALDRLEGNGKPRDWDDFTKALESLARDSGDALTQDAGLRGTRRIAERLQAIIFEETEALIRPLDESEHRLVALGTAIDEAQRCLHDLGYLFTAEQHRLAAVLRHRHHAFLSGARNAAHTQLTSVLRGLPRARGPLFRTKAMVAAQEVTHDHVIPWLALEQSLAEEEYARAMLRFTELADESLRKLANAGVRDMGSFEEFVSSPQRFRVKPKFCFNRLLHIAQPASPIRLVTDILLGAVGAHKVIEEDAHQFLDQMLEVNSSRVENDLQDRVADSRQRLEADIRAVFREASSIAERALTRSRATHQSGAVAVQAALKRLKEIESEIAAIQCGVF